MIMTDAPKFCVGDAVCLSHAGHTVYDDIKWFADQIYRVTEINHASEIKIEYHNKSGQARHVWLRAEELELVQVYAEFSDDEFLDMIGVC